MAYNIISLKDMYDSLGEVKLKELLDDFKCDLNNDVEYFIKTKSIEFMKLDLARTFVVTSTYKNKNVIVGYFSLTSKVTTVKKSILSKTMAKRLARFSEKNDIKDYYVIPLPLIGQLSKNYKNNYNELISGDELLKMACNKVKEAQNILGGKFAFLECEDNPKLKEFYESNGFVCFGKRELDKEERGKTSGNYLLQMLCDLSKNT